MKTWPDMARSLCARMDSSPCIDRGQNIVVIGCDLYNGTVTGVACNMNANSNASANHAGPSALICVQFCGDKTDPSFNMDTAYCIPKNPISDRQQAVCIPLTNRGIVCEGGGYAKP